MNAIVKMWRGMWSAKSAEGTTTASFFSGRGILDPKRDEPQTPSPESSLSIAVGVSEDEDTPLTQTQFFHDPQPEADESEATALRDAGLTPRSGAQKCEKSHVPVFAWKTPLPHHYFEELSKYVKVNSQRTSLVVVG